MADDERGSRRLGGLVNMAGGQLSTLVRQEIGLAKRELVRSVKQASEGAALLGGAGASGGMALFFVSVAAWQGLGKAIGPTRSALLMASLYGGGAVVLGRRGMARLRRVEGAPRTVESLKRIPPTLTPGDS